MIDEPSGGNVIVSSSQKSFINRSRFGFDAKLPTYVCANDITKENCVCQSIVCGRAQSGVYVWSIVYSRYVVFPIESIP